MCESMGSELQSPDHVRKVYGRGRPAATEKRMGTRSTRHRSLSQRLPTNQGAPQREERPVDVGPLVIPHAQTAKLIESGKRPLHDPPPPAQSTPVRGAKHGEPRHDMPRPQSAPNRLGIVAAIAQHTVRPPPRSPPFALEWGNRINQRQGFLRVVPVGTGQAERERHATAVANQMALAPALRSVGRIRTGLRSAIHRGFYLRRQVQFTGPFQGSRARLTVSNPTPCVREEAAGVSALSGKIIHGIVRFCARGAS